MSSHFVLLLYVAIPKLARCSTGAPGTIVVSSRTRSTLQTSMPTHLSIPHHSMYGCPSARNIHSSVIRAARAMEFQSHTLRNPSCWITSRNTIQSHWYSHFHRTMQLFPVMRRFLVFRSVWLLTTATSRASCRRCAVFWTRRSSVVHSHWIHVLYSACGCLRIRVDCRRMSWVRLSSTSEPDCVSSSSRLLNYKSDRSNSSSACFYTR